MYRLTMNVRINIDTEPEVMREEAAIFILRTNSGIHVEARQTTVGLSQGSTTALALNTLLSNKCTNI